MSKKLDLELEDVHLTCDGHHILHGINLRIFMGEIVFIVGPSGSGKTSLLKVCSGLLEPTRGRVRLHFAEREAPLGSPIGFVFQGGGLISNMTARQNLELPLLYHTNLDRAEISRRAEAALRTVNALDAAELRPVALSLGLARRVAIARALIVNPAIVFYDEPTIGLDSQNAQAIQSLIKKMCDENKSTSVVATHDLEWAKRIAHRIVIVFDGTVRRAGRPDELQRDPDREISGYFQASSTPPERKG